MSLPPQVLGRTQQEGHELGGISLLAPTKPLKPKEFFTAVPLTGRELRGHEEGKSHFGKLQSSPRERDLGGKTSREAGKQPGVLEVHHTQ